MLNLGAVLLFLTIILDPFASGARADRIVSTDVEGTQFKIGLASGRLLRSPALAGAVLNLALPGGTTGRVRIDQVQQDPEDQDGDIFLHRLLVANPRIIGPIFATPTRRARAGRFRCTASGIARDGEPRRAASR